MGPEEELPFTIARETIYSNLTFEGITEFGPSALSLNRSYLFVSKVRTFLGGRILSVSLLLNYFSIHSRSLRSRVIGGN